VSDSLQQQQQQQQQEESSSESSSGGGGDVSGQGEEGGASSLEEQLSAARQEHERLARAWLLLQDEYWRQKERGMALEIEAGQLRGSWRAAEEKLEKVRGRAWRGRNEKGGTAGESRGLSMTAGAHNCDQAGCGCTVLGKQFCTHLFVVVAMTPPAIWSSNQPVTSACGRITAAGCGGGGRGARGGGRV
jgi:hypothetical protein